MGDLVSPAVDLDLPFEPQDAVGKSIRSAVITGSAGLFLAAVQNTVTRESVGAMGVFSRHGATIALFAGMGGVYTFVKKASANLREHQDPYNDALGGFAAGALVGLRKRTFPSMLGNGLALSVAMAVVSYSGSVFGKESRTQDVDNATKKEEVRKRFRRPVNETINELGEGRGIYGPGYEERRKQRIKDKYGIEIEEPYYNKVAAGNTV